MCHNKSEQEESAGSGGFSKKPGEIVWSDDYNIWVFCFFFFPSSFSLFFCMDLCCFVFVFVFSFYGQSVSPKGCVLSGLWL